jgi:delta 1-pyrroline-5-carboxylate dehydrogenase
MTIAQEEIFGPVLVIIPYEDEDDAVRIANDTIYGLAGGVWSKDKERALRVAKRLRTGQVEINGGQFNALAPFGGYKQSGHGRELGRFGVEEFLQTKSLQLQLDSSSRRFARATPPYQVRLGFGVRSIVVRSTAMSPNFGRYPSFHSKLSRIDQ